MVAVNTDLYALGMFVVVAVCWIVHDLIKGVHK